VWGLQATQVTGRGAQSAIKLKKTVFMKPATALAYRVAKIAETGSRWGKRPIRGGAVQGQARAEAPLFTVLYAVPSDAVT